MTKSLQNSETGEKKGGHAAILVCVQNLLCIHTGTWGKECNLCGLVPTFQNGSFCLLQ